MKIVVVGFVLNRKNSIGYRAYVTPEMASKYVRELLEKGADVISIRRIYENSVEINTKANEVDQEEKWDES